nr:hypothetical protein [Tanacetum cinerariifolium]
MAQNIDFSGLDQIQTPQYLDIHPPSQEISDEVFQANHSIQNKEPLENSSNEIATLSSNQEKEEPLQDSNIHQLIKECSTEIHEEQKQNKRDCDVPVFTIDVCDNHSDTFFDSKIDDDISVYDDDFEDIDSIPPGIENVADDTEGDIRFLEELLIDDSILSHESSDSNFEDNPSIPRPPPEPPDAETDAGEEIPVVMNDKDKFDEDYYFFMIDKVFSFLYAESEDTIFDPGISN